MAAGGRHARHLTTPGGQRATARVTLRVRPATRRAYAYLVWNHNRVRHELLLGESTHPHRALNLQAAWTLVKDNALLTPAGRSTWPRRVSPAESTGRTTVTRRG